MHINGNSANMGILSALLGLWITCVTCFTDATVATIGVKDGRYRFTDSVQLPQQMRAVRKVGVQPCGPPAFGCVAVVNTTTTPSPLTGEILINVTSSGLNPDELSILKTPVLDYTLGIDVAGVVLALGASTTNNTRIQVGDMVYCCGIKGGMAQYAIRPEMLCGVLDPSTKINMTTIGTLPTVAITSYGALHSAGAPWNQTKPNTSFVVLITAGTGGTGYLAVQMAKAMGATKVVTAATGDGIAFAKSLGADIVVDYMTTSVYDAVANQSVDVVLSNHKSNTTAFRAMPKLKAPGGVYVTLDEDVVPASDIPAGVTQVDYDMFHLPEVTVICHERKQAMEKGDA
eukprot:m.100799 g.100799  ORF g.100799 m.100799 type:complete len:344 (-) comp27275_c0_seq2:100-1131(-)